MKRKLPVMVLAILLIFIALTKATFGEVTTRAVLQIANDGKNETIEDSSIRVAHTITNVEDKSFILNVEVENLQDQGTEVALVLDNSFSMWSESKINIYKAKMIETDK